MQDRIAPDHKKLPQLTSIRFFAAFAVVCHHFYPDRSIPWAKTLLDSAGDGGVSLFFVLSGFVLTISNRGMDGSLVRTRGDYLVNRFARIYPLYALSFVLCAPFVIAVTVARYPDFGAAAVRIGGNAAVYLGLLQAWIPPLANAWNGPGWSLSTETFFYIAFLFVVPPAARRVGLWVPVCVLVLLTAAAAAQYLTPGETWRHFWYFLPPLRFAEFALGMATAQVFRFRTYPSWLARFSGPTALAALAGVLVLAIWGNPITYRLATSTLFPLLILALALALALGNGVATRLLSWQPLVVLGEASYGLYLIQVPMMGWYVLVTQGVMLGALSSIADFAAYAVFAVSISVFLHYRFEQPVGAFIKSAWLTRRGAARTMLPPDPAA